MASSKHNRLAALIAVLLAVSGYAVVRSFGRSGAGAESVGSSSLGFEPHQLPQLETGLLAPPRDLEPSSPRNPFAYGPPPTPTRDPRPTPTPPPPPPPPTPPPTRTPGPSPTPLPPPFDRSYIGHLGPNRLPVAVFRKGDELEVAATGTVLDNRFIVREVGLESVVIGFVGYPQEVTTRVPLAEN